jgi:hypothetical protein
MTHEHKEWLERVQKRLSEPVYCAVSASELVRVMIDELPKEQAPELFDCDLSRRDDGATISTPFILTSKKKKLQGRDIKKFWVFWKAFDYKNGRAEAAQAWMDIPDTKDYEFMQHITYAAKQTVIARKPGGATPKMAQGWLSGRRWEDYEPQATPDDWRDWTNDDWRRKLGGVGSKFHPGFAKGNWTQMPWFPNPSPWVKFNPHIPEEIYDIYAVKWGWVK